jgi:hypothetical protein
MRNTVLDKLTDYMSKKNAPPLPYKTKIGLSMFLGQNLDSTMIPQNMMHNQMVLGVNEMQKQAQDMQAMKPSKTGMGKMKSYENDMTTNMSAAARHSQMRSV